MSPLEPERAPLGCETSRFALSQDVSRPRVFPRDLRAARILFGPEGVNETSRADVTFDGLRAGVASRALGREEPASKQRLRRMLRERFAGR